MHNLPCPSAMSTISISLNEATAVPSSSTGSEWLRNQQSRRILGRGLRLQKASKFHAVVCFYTGFLISIGLACVGQWRIHLQRRLTLLLQWGFFSFDFISFFHLPFKTFKWSIVHLNKGWPMIRMNESFRRSPFKLTFIEVCRIIGFIERENSEGFVWLALSHSVLDFCVWKNHKVFKVSCCVWQF